LLRRAFVRAVDIAMESTSMATTRPAPKRFPASARIPLPVPKSRSDQGDSGERTRPREQRCALRATLLPAEKSFRRGAENGTRGACAPWSRVISSSNRRDIAVVMCSPVPKAAPAGITMREGPLGRDRRDTEVPPTFKMIKRFPMLKGMLLRLFSKRFNQSRGSFSNRPPKLLTSSPTWPRDLHATSSRERFCPGRSIIARSLPAYWRRICSFVLTQRGSTSFLQRNIFLYPHRTQVSKIVAAVCDRRTFLIARRAPLNGRLRSIAPICSFPDLEIDIATQ
jgi:hypothetical protein